MRRIPENLVGVCLVHATYCIFSLLLLLIVVYALYKLITDIHDADVDTYKAAFISALGIPLMRGSFLKYINTSEVRAIYNENITIVQCVTIAVLILLFVYSSYMCIAPMRKAKHAK